MATSNDTARKQCDMKEKPAGRLLGHRRVATMLEAAYQAAALHDLLALALASDGDRRQLRRQADILLPRLRVINNILISGLDDSIETATDLLRRLEGGLCMGERAGVTQ